MQFGESWGRKGTISFKIISLFNTNVTLGCEFECDLVEMTFLNVFINTIFMTVDLMKTKVVLPACLKSVVLIYMLLQMIRWCYNEVEIIL